VGNFGSSATEIMAKTNQSIQAVHATPTSHQWHVRD